LPTYIAGIIIAVMGFSILVGSLSMQNKKTSEEDVEKRTT
jgi:hypothetical protein